MPKAWSDKDERKYEHIKDSLRDQGRSEDQAEEIAARTVNKSGARKRTHKTVRAPATEQRARGAQKQELLNRARQLDVKGRSRMSKSELANAIRHP